MTVTQTAMPLLVQPPPGPAQTRAGNPFADGPCRGPCSPGEAHRVKSKVESPSRPGEATDSDGFHHMARTPGRPAPAKSDQWQLERYNRDHHRDPSPGLSSTWVEAA